jgi:Cys-tRNA(Pro) deacylase
VSTTPALRALRAAGVAFAEHPYRYEERGGTRVSARELGVDEHHVVKTLVVQDDQRRLHLVLMARLLGVKRMDPAEAGVAQRATGYQFGGTSPFGTRQPLPTYVERTILDLSRVYINGGSRGLLVSVDPEVLVRVLQAVPVEVGITP